MASTKKREWAAKGVVGQMRGRRRLSAVNWRLATLVVALVLLLLTLGRLAQLPP